MALGDIVDRILADARDEAARIRAAGDDSGRSLLAEAAQAAAARRDEQIAKAHGELLLGKRDRLAGVGLEARKRVLAVKRELVGEVFAEVEQGLKNRPAAEYAAFLAGLVPAEVTDEPGVVVLGKGDAERHGADFPGLLSAALRRRHPAWDFALEASPGDFDAGMLLRSGRSVHDLSLEALLAERRERWELAVGKALFAP